MPAGPCTPREPGAGSGNLVLEGKLLALGSQMFHQGNFLLALGGWRVISYLIRNFLGEIIGFLHLLCSEMLRGHSTFTPGGAGQANTVDGRETKGKVSSLTP